MAKRISSLRKALAKLEAERDSIELARLNKLLSVADGKRHRRPRRSARKRARKAR